MNGLKNKGKFLRDVWHLTKSYWQSEEKRKAYVLLGDDRRPDFGCCLYAGAAQ